jgi:hypothetical protein
MLCTNFYFFLCQYLFVLCISLFSSCLRVGCHYFRLFCVLFYLGVAEISGLRIDHNFDNGTEAKIAVNAVPISQSTLGEHTQETLYIDSYKPELIKIACERKDVRLIILLHLFICSCCLLLCPFVKFILFVSKGRTSWCFPSSKCTDKRT